MSNSSQIQYPWNRHLVFANILAVVLIGLVGLAIIEASTHSLLFRKLLNIDYRLPLAPVVYIGAVLFAAALFLLDRVHHFSDWFAPIRGDLAKRASGRFDWIVTIASLWILAVLIWHSFGNPIDMKLTDYFHEGEILGGLPIIKRGADIPILIHGPGRNLMPAALAVYFAQPGHEIAFMRFVSGIGAMTTLLMVAMATYAFAFALLDELSSNSRRHLISTFASLLGTFVAIGEAHVTDRHVLFVLSLALATTILYTADRKRGQALMLSAVFGIVCALAPIHVYATGLETLVVALTAALILLAHQGFSAFRLLGTALAGSIACVFVVIVLGGTSLYFNAIRDILWWGSKAQGIWSLPLSGSHAITHTALLIASLSLSGYLAFRHARSEEPAQRRSAVLLALLAFAIAIAARDMLERSDVAHSGFSMLTVAVGVGALATPLFLRLTTRSPRLLAAFGIGIILLVSEGDPRRIYWKLADKTPKLVQLDTPDINILSDDVRSVTQRFGTELANSHCLLVLTNEGVLNYVTNLPPCGDFFYPIYASVPAGDHRLADWLKANPQQVAVVETDFWSDNIDGKPMNSRIPDVWALVEENMPSKIKLGGRVFAVRQ